MTKLISSYKNLKWEWNEAKQRDCSWQPVLGICNVLGKSLRFQKGIWRKFGIVQFLFEMFISFFSYLSLPFLNF